MTTSTPNRLAPSRAAPRAARALGIAVLCLASSGCGFVNWLKNGLELGPDYAKPETKTASTWIDYKDPRVKSTPVDLARWWKVFRDPALDSLIEQAYSQDLTLRAAGERIAAAHARRNVQIGFLFPQDQQAFGDMRWNHTSKEGANFGPGTERTFTSWNVGVGAAWELDLWGRFRRAIEAADAELDASVANYDDVMVVLFSEVARNYINYRTFEERLVAARQNVEIQRKSLVLAEDKFKAGAVTERDVQEARQILAETQARIPPLEAGRREASNAICLLLGGPPRDLGPELKAGKVPVVAPAVAVGIPADLLRRRPDVRRVERLAAAQSAEIGIAEADWYPSFSIIGQIGLDAEHFSDLWKTAAGFGSFGPSFRWNILNYGRIWYNVEAENADFRAAAFDYQESVLRAAKEAEDALVNFVKAGDRTAYLAQSVTAAARTVEIANDQYIQGSVDFTTVFLFQGTLAEQEDTLAASRGDIALALVSLYRALGGGWERRMAEAGAQ